MAYTLSQMPDIKAILSKCSSGLLRQLNDYISPHTEIYEHIFAAIKDEPASSVKEGDIIREGYNERCV